MLQRIVSVPSTMGAVLQLLGTKTRPSAFVAFLYAQPIFLKQSRSKEGGKHQKQAFVSRKKTYELIRLRDVSMCFLQSGHMLQLLW